ncbi:MAG: hypothetical protein K2Q15_03475, partial [Burkholderiales bacterium]|nr:hypothetical protein [Burkholderiales bacterium]
MTTPSPDTLQAIHFDTLWAQVQDTLATQSVKVWNDTAEHDPGVTLLQALTYSVSDLGYRHSLPLADLLTPAPKSDPKPDEQVEDNLFPEAFGPHQVLTVSPVTEDDYRRALLDLILEQEGDKYFLFRNARLLPEAESERYSYVFDPELREFHFPVPDNSGNASAVKDTGQNFTVQGCYRLQVELNRGVLQEQAEPILQDFLRANRNLCEGVRAIEWLQPKDVNVTITLELEDDFQDYAALLAQVYQCVDQHISPPVERASAAQLREQGLANEAIYQGPWLRYGWISKLPPAEDYDSARALNLTPLAAPLQTLAGVKRLHTLQFNGAQWELGVEAKNYPLLWGAKPEVALCASVTLLKRGQQMPVETVALPAPTVCTEPLAHLPYGRHRKPAQVYPASDKIPPCYQLQDPDVPDIARPLHQYLLPFEQGLANACDQLARLPRLLAFDRSTLG